MPRTRREGRGPALHGLSRPVAALHHPRRASSTRRSSRTGSGFDGSSIRGWQAINESDMLWSRSRRRRSSTRSRADPDAVDDLQHPGPDHPARTTPATRATSPARRSTTCKSTGVADTCYIGPEAEFFIFDDVRFDQTPQLRLLLPRQRRGRLEPRPRREARTSATSCGTRRATSPCPPTDSSWTSAPR